jgi:hypothetical protein
MPRRKFQTVFAPTMQMISEVMGPNVVFVCGEIACGEIAHTGVGGDR